MGELCFVHLYTKHIVVKGETVIHLFTSTFFVLQLYIYFSACLSLWILLPL